MVSCYSCNAKLGKLRRAINGEYEKKANPEHSDLPGIRAGEPDPSGNLRRRCRNSPADTKKTKRHSSYGNADPDINPASRRRGGARGRARAGSVECCGSLQGEPGGDHGIEQPYGAIGDLPGEQAADQAAGINTDDHCHASQQPYSNGDTAQQYAAPVENAHPTRHSDLRDGGRRKHAQPTGTGGLPGRPTADLDQRSGADWDRAGAGRQCDEAQGERNLPAAGALKEITGRGGDTPGNLRRSTGCRQHGGDVLIVTAGDGHLFLPVKGGQVSLA